MFDIELGKKLPVSGENSQATQKKKLLLPGRAEIFLTAPTTREKPPSSWEKIPATREKITVVFKIVKRPARYLGLLDRTKNNARRELPASS